ncbi:hypothetical protein C8R46DRAFT_853228, partial [Mycena filopes]
DPLVRFGAHEGVIPGRSAEDSIACRDILIRWTYPHVELLWATLEEGMKVVVGLGSATKYIEVYEVVQGAHMYCLRTDVLLMLGHVCLAIQQIIDGLSTFLDKAEHHYFTVDPQFRFLLLLERHNSRSEICYAFSALLLRINNARSHIKTYLNGLQQIFTDSMLDERYSSVNSTVTSVRSEFLRGDTLLELYKLLARAEY